MEKIYLIVYINDKIDLDRIQVDFTSEQIEKLSEQIEKLSDSLTRGVSATLNIKNYGFSFLYDNTFPDFRITYLIIDINNQYAVEKAGLSLPDNILEYLIRKEKLKQLI